MKSLSIAFLVALVGIAAVFLILSLAGLDKSVAGPIATAIMGGIPYIRESLEKRERLQAGNGAGSRILSLAGFGIPPVRVVLYGTLILVAVMLVSSAFAGMIATASRAGTMEGHRAIAGTFAFALVLPAQFLIGRWVGRRGAGRGILAVILIAAFESSRHCAPLLRRGGRRSLLGYRAGLGSYVCRWPQRVQSGP